MSKSIVLGADAWGMELKNAIKKHLEDKGLDVIDIGMHSSENEIPYFKVAAAAARMIQKGEAERGLLFCGTGMGVAIVANKFKGIHAGVIESEFTGGMCKIVNNCNIMTMGGMIISQHKAKMAVDKWLESAHTEGMEPWLADFLKNSLKEIEKIENENYK